MKCTILGQGTAVPPYSIGRDESVKYVNDFFCRTDKERRIVPALYRMAGVQNRHSVLLKAPEGAAEKRYALLHAPTHEHDMGPSVRRRMVEYEKESGPLAIESSSKALKNADVDAKDITHLVTVSCSGFFAPGVDVTLIKELGLPTTVQRVHVGFMGCHGALNGIRTARGFAESDPSARVLLCAVEVCSIHYHYGWNPEQLVANALFADGSAALVAGATDDGAAWRVGDTGACLIPESEDAMTWRIGDNGFEMSLSNQVPTLIETHLRPWLEEWLGRNGLGVEDIQTWAVHPGGPRILSSVSKAMELDKDALAVSKDTLKNYGNMSSPTILFIVNRLREENAPRPCVALAFGPGLMAEATLFV